MRFASPRWNISDDPDAGWKAVDWSVHTHQAAVRGRRITYADIGSGPATVLVHGQGGSWQWWLRVLPTVSPHRRVIAVDLPGFGGSDPIARGDVFTEHVATIIGLLDHLGLADATIAGHSMGGLVALQVACDHPDRVAGLMLIDAGGANISARRLALIVTGLRAFSRHLRDSVGPPCCGAGALSTVCVDVARHARPGNAVNVVGNGDPSPHGCAGIRAVATRGGDRGEPGEPPTRSRAPR